VLAVQVRGGRYLNSGVPGHGGEHASARAAKSENTEPKGSPHTVPCYRAGRQRGAAGGVCMLRVAPVIIDANLVHQLELLMRPR
jgi:hypothetical protein